MTNDQKQGGKLLIDDWRQAHKMWSVLAAAMLAGFDTLHGVLPAVQSVVGPTAFTWINVGSAVAIVVLRVLNQPGSTDVADAGTIPAPTPQTPKEPSA